jgi:hypothetical protein
VLSLTFSITQCDAIYRPRPPVHTAGLVRDAIAPGVVAPKATARPAALGHISLESAHALCGRSGRCRGRTAMYKSACCTKTARRASVGMSAANCGLSAAEWCDHASREARWRLRGDRFRRDRFMRQAEVCMAGGQVILVSSSFPDRTAADQRPRSHIQRSCPAARPQSQTRTFSGAREG